MTYHALALDLDGTTLTSDHTIKPVIKDAILRIKEKHTVILVTGRHHTAAHPYHHELALTTPIICCNGTYVYDYGRRHVLAEDGIPHPLARRFIALAQGYQLKLVMYVSDRMVHLSHTPVRYMAALQQWASGFPEAIRPQVATVNSFEEELTNSSHIWKFVAEGDLAAMEGFSTHPWICEHFSGEQSWSNRIDFARRGNSKGSRLKEYLDQHAIDPAQLVAIGDNHNDTSMLRLAGLGVAMANAAPQIQQIAQLVTAESNDGRGMLDVLTRYFPV